MATQGPQVVAFGRLLTGDSRTDLDTTSRYLTQGGLPIGAKLMARVADVPSTKLLIILEESTIIGILSI